MLGTFGSFLPTNSCQSMFYHYWFDQAAEIAQTLGIEVGMK
jgi:hypothetical protein